MNPITLEYDPTKTLDGGHPNQAGWEPFATSNYAGATAFMATLV
jgi:hypothetical protein